MFTFCSFEKQFHFQLKIPLELDSNCFRKPMVWSSLHDEMLGRKSWLLISGVDPFTGTKKSTVARGKKWEEVAENLN